VDLLINRGADLFAERDNEVTPLHWAAGTGNIAIAALLLASGAKV
jgi:ankyrin repeat protein